MKFRRMVSIIILILMAVTGAFASEQPDSIQFRDIPWLSSPQDFCLALLEAGFSAENTVSFFEEGRWNSEKTLLPEWEYGPVPQFCVTFKKSDEIPIGTVGDYQVRTICAYFLAGYDYDLKKYSHNKADSRLVRVACWIHGGENENEMNSAETVYDLTDKLSKLYGEYREIDDSPYFSTRKDRIWRAGDDSAVVLCYDTMESEFSPYNWFVTVTYSRCDEQYVKELYECAVNEIAGDTDG